MSCGDMNKEKKSTFKVDSKKQTWLSQDVATRKLALGLKQRLETESPGGLTTYIK